MGYDIGLYSQYKLIRELSGTEMWTVERAAEEMERVFRPAIEAGNVIGG